MRSMSAKDAKNHFGELLLEAQKAPVTIEKNGRPVAVLYSYEEHHQVERAKLEWLRAAIAEADADAAAGREYEMSDQLMAQIKAEGRSLLDD
jgi:prevent-host-death family protein